MFLKNRIIHAPAAVLVSVLSCTFISGCALADLRGEELRREVSRAAMDRGRELLRAARAAQGLEKTDPGAPTGKTATPLMEAVGRDIWYASITRRFTPLEKDNQRFRMRMTSKGERFEFLDGPNKGRVIGRRDKRFFFIPVGALKREPVFKESSSSYIYLESLRLYMELPMLAANMSHVAYMGREKIGGRTFDLVYASPGGFGLDGGRDQYVFALDSETRRIEYIRFTYRAVFSFYRGVLRYRDFRRQGRLLLPFRIAVLDKADDSEPVHEIVLEKIVPRP